MGRTFVHRLRVRDEECDPAGFALYGSFVAYFETVCAELWRAAIKRHGDLPEAGFATAVAEVHVRYLRLAELDDELRVEARVVEITRSSVVTEIDVANGGSPVATGVIRHVLVDAGAGRFGLTDELRAALGRYVVERTRERVAARA